MHGNNTVQTHRLDLFVGEQLTDEAGNFDIRGLKFTSSCESADVSGDSVVALEGDLPEDGDFGRHGRGRLEERRTENVFGVILTDAEAFFLEMADPLLTSFSIAGN